MTPMMRFAAYLALTVMLGYAIDDAGFGIVNSPEALLATLLFAPGHFAVVFVAAMGVAIGTAMSWVLFACINCIYYEALYRAASQMLRPTRAQ